MGRYVMLGQVTTPQITSAVSSGLMTAAIADPEPFSKAGLFLASLFTKLFGFGYDPTKLNDTAITEAVQIGLHQLWYQLTGEDLGGVQPTCTPGKCGEQHVNIFSGSTQYPHVPYGPLGDSNIDVNQMLAQVEQLIAEGRSKLLRPESVSAYEANTSYMRDRFHQVGEARAQQSPFETVTGLLPRSVLQWLPWALAGYAVYRLI